MTMSKLIRKNISLSDFTTFGVGGLAEYLAEVKNKEELEKALNFAKEKRLKILLLGGGSNVLISDKGFGGLVIINKLRGVEVDGEKITTLSGENLHHVVEISVRERLMGLCKLGWIPGTIGGAVAGNAGAYGVAIGDFVEAVDAFDLVKNNRVRLNRDQCEFAYRSSVFKKNMALIVLSVELRLIPGKDDEVKKEFEKIREKRDGNLPKYPSCGCNFKNFEAGEFEDSVVKKLKELSPKTDEVLEKSKGKLPVGFIIETLGLKGRTIGDAKVSNEHANIIVNTGSAKANDIYKLIKLVEKEVRSKLDLDLTLEIEIIGKFK